MAFSNLILADGTLDYEERVMKCVADFLCPSLPQDREIELDFFIRKRIMERKLVNMNCIRIYGLFLSDSKIATTFKSILVQKYMKSEQGTFCVSGRFF